MKSFRKSRTVIWLIRILLVLIVACALYLSNIQISRSVMSVLYTVNGILFSIAMSQLVSFSLEGVSNEVFVNSQRMQIHRLRFSFIAVFALITVSFLLSGLESSILVNGIIDAFTLSVLVFGLAYNVINYCDLAKAAEQIEDRVHKARKEITSEGHQGGELG